MLYLLSNFVNTWPFCCIRYMHVGKIIGPWARWPCGATPHKSINHYQSFYENLAYVESNSAILTTTFLEHCPFWTMFKMITSEIIKKIGIFYISTFENKLFLLWTQIHRLNLSQVVIFFISNLLKYFRSLQSLLAARIPSLLSSGSSILFLEILSSFGTAPTHPVIGPPS